jgi:hypothetical protein
MPVQIRFSASGMDTLVVMPINNGPQIDTFNIAFWPSSVVLDPNSWLLKQVTYLSIEEEAAENNHKPLWNIYPNPSRGQIKISYNLPSGQNALISVYNRNGQLVKRLSTNRHGFLVWDGKDELGKRVGSGVYFVKLVTPNKSYAEKVVILP